MGRYIQVNVSTEGLFQIANRSWSDIGIVGRGIGSGFTVNQAYVIKSPTEAKDLFGATSALYKSILLAFQNGATKIIAIPAAVIAQTQETFSGDGSTVEFTLTGEIPAQPLDVVNLTVGGAQVEGTDFTVDYGNKKITFVTAPITGVDNVEIDFSSHLTAQIQSALVEMENQDVQLICLAMVNDATLLADLLSHVNTMESTSPRMAIYMLKNGETSVTLATTLAGKLNVLIAHKSENDVASACIGKIASRKPWESLTLRDVIGLQQTGKFNSTEESAFDSAKIVIMIDPPKLSGNAYVFSKGFTLGTILTNIDQVRIIHYITSILELGLTNPNVIGKMKMNGAGLRQLNAFIASLLNPQVNAGAIDNYTIVNPALTLFETQNPDSGDIANMTALQTSRSLSGVWAIGIQVVYAGAIEFIRIELELTGGV